jgi:hypothetical protein
MLGIDDDQLATMRAQVIELLPDVGIIKEPVRVNDGAGGASLTYRPVTGGTQPVRFDPFPLRNAEKVQAEAKGLTIEYICTFPYNAPVQPEYHVVHNSVEYQVVGLAAEHSWNVSRRAYVARVG